MNAQQIKQVMSESLVLPVDMLKDEAAFGDDLGADSLDLVHMMLDLEDKLSIGIPDWQAAKALTVAEAVALVTRLAAEQRAA